MENIIKSANARLTEVLALWDNVDTITVIHFGENRLDPNFMVSYDVYLTGIIPSAEEREKLFHFGTMFETSVDDGKDRFMIDDLPVRVEYKNRDHVEKQILAAADADRGIRDESTYVYFRIVYSAVVFSRTPWRDQMVRNLSSIPREYWENRTKRLRSRMEHYLGDLTAALYGEDQFFYLISLAGFLNSVCALIFAVNREFETAPRSISSVVQTLPVQPPEFAGRFTNLLRDDTAVSRVRKRELAQLIARSMLYL